MSKAIYPQKNIIVVVGPTASGKSDLAVRLARQFNGEVISADSRQVYRDMNLGTGKITVKEMKNIPHYLLNVASPRRRFTAAQFKRLAGMAVKKIQTKNKLPIICGGTGFYIQALVDNLAIPEVAPNLALRAQLEKQSTEKLFMILKKLDPRRAKSIDPYNRRRLIRAIEIVKTTSRPVPPLKTTPPENVLFLGIKKSPHDLARRINIRLKKRLQQGLIAEVKTLRQQGLSWKRLDDFGLEYRWIARYLQKKISRDEMIVRLQKEIKHYAKRQMTWFGQDKRIRWIKNYKEALPIIKNTSAK